MKEQLLPFRSHRCKWVPLLLLFFSQFGYSQINIQVVDENNLPMIGVTIIYNSKYNTTDKEGRVDLPARLADSTIIQFRYISYEDISMTFGALKQAGRKLQMSPKEALLEEILIIGRTNTLAFDLPYEVERIGSDRIFASKAQTTADALQINGSAYVQKSQMGGGSPVLRGFEANKILLVVDGVRMNNAIYRNGHMQNAITVDPAILKQIELIYGPGSLMYGSDALGGVIHFRTQSPFRQLGTQAKPHNANAYFRYNSANNEKSIHFDHSYSKDNWGVLNSISFSDYGDLRAGGNRPDDYPEFGKRNNYADRINGRDTLLINEDPNLQIGSAYRQMDLLQKWAYNTNDLRMELDLQYSTTGDIPRYDALIEMQNDHLRYAEWFYGPQKRLLISPRITWAAKNKFFDEMIAIASFQDIYEERNTRIFGQSSRETQKEDLNVYGITFDLNKKISSLHELRYGIDFHYNDLMSTAHRTDLETGITKYDILTRYPDGESSLYSMGAYLQHNWKNKDSTMQWINGIRFNRQKVDFIYESMEPVEWPDYFYEGVSNTDNSIVGLTGLNIRHRKLTARISTGTAFRAPNIDDLAKIRINNNEINVPNPRLNAEKVWNTEVNLDYATSDMSAGFSAYYTRLMDAIIRDAASLPGGSPLYITDGDTLNVTSNVNAESGTIQGISAQLNWNVTRSLSASGIVNLQKGSARTEEGEERPLGHIPPAFGKVSLAYEYKNLHFDLLWRFNLWKHIDRFGGSVDNPNLATEDGTPAWHVFGIDLHWDATDNFLISAGLHNIFDLHYRTFSSGISAPGRHISLALRYSY